MSSPQKRTIDAASVLCGASAAVCAVIAAIIAIWAFSGGYDATRIGLAQIQYDVVYDFQCLPVFNRHRIIEEGTNEWNEATPQERRASQEAKWDVARIAGDAQGRAFRYTGGASILQVFFSVGLWLLSSLSCRRLYLSSRMSSRKLTGPAYVLVCVVLCVSTFLLVNFIGSSLGILFSEDIGPYIGSKAIHGWKFGVLSLLGTVGAEFSRNPFLTSVVLVVLLWGPMFWLWSKAVALISRSMSSDEEESQEGNSAQCEVSPDDNRL